MRQKFGGYNINLKKMIRKQRVVKRMLMARYGNPEQVKSAWKAESRYFCYGTNATRIDEFHQLLTNNQFALQQQNFIDLMYDYYFRPEGCRTLRDQKAGF
jgi:hypothetical protein